MGQVEAKLYGAEDTKKLFTKMIKEFPTRVVAAGVRAGMKPFISMAKNRNKPFGDTYKVKVYNRKRNIPVIIAGSWKIKGGKNHGKN